jgi:hypothetical protein
MRVSLHITSIHTLSVAEETTAKQMDRYCNIAQLVKCCTSGCSAFRERVGNAAAVTRQAKDPKLWIARMAIRRTGSLQASATEAKRLRIYPPYWCYWCKISQSWFSKSSFLWCRFMRFACQPEGLKPHNDLVNFARMFPGPSLQ